MENDKKRCMAKKNLEGGRCDKDATVALKFEFFACVGTSPAEAYINVFVCDDHKLSDAEIKQFLDINFETMAAGFDLVGKMRPDIDLTSWEWKPIAEAEEFWNKGAAAPNLKTAYKN